MGGIKNFFEFVSKNELTQDLTYQSDEYYTQEEFLAFIDVLNAEDEEDIIDAISNFQENEFIIGYQSFYQGARVAVSYL